MTHRGGFTAGKHQPVNGFQFVAPPDTDRVGAAITQCRQMLANVALKRQNADPWATH